MLDDIVVELRISCVLVRCSWVRHKVRSFCKKHGHKGAEDQTLTRVTQFYSFEDVHQCVILLGWAFSYPLSHYDMMIIMFELKYVLSTPLM